MTADSGLKPLPRARLASEASGAETRLMDIAETASNYAELHALSNFTFLRGASHPEELVQTAAKLGYEALALTD